MNTLMPIVNGSAPMNTSNWLHSSVQEFFSTLNWEDLPPDTQQMGQVTSQYSDAPLSLNLSVSSFFAAVNWEGATIAAPVSVPIQSSPANNFTLDDFSGLFG
ncbi:hypothetical protein JOY44_07540 [Phormidium sp. CLA17]|uniref:hypothetical protein n=1 Tax=Leptolyngbya sp. Cla-17 TaxID=2803751 RepID=UPI0014917879|nr:hypothetical protein [Leptolyngbya sp. Cla-17]MBM0741467.1 hypothetical protein [Leptolyngbya sp. Cla-17]